MIFGDCPYQDCSGFHAIACAEKTPAFSKEVCESCGRAFWLRHSRIDPDAYTLEEFEAKYVVDEQAMQIRERNPQPPPDPSVVAAFEKAFEDLIINGTGNGVPIGLLSVKPKKI